MPRKKPIEVKQPEPEVEVSLGPVKSKMQRSTLCCGLGAVGLLSVFILYMLAFGRFPFFDGFALAAQTKQVFDSRLEMINALGGSLDRLEIMVSDNSKSIKAVIFTGQINNTQRAYCAALKAQDQSAIALAGDQLTGLLIDYQRLTGEDFPIRPCP